MKRALLALCLFACDDGSTEDPPPTADAATPDGTVAPDGGDVTPDAGSRP